MFDKWKNVKTAGTVVILAAVAIFLFMNVRIKSADSYRAEKSTGFAVENVNQEMSEAATEALAGETEATVPQTYASNGDKYSNSETSGQSQAGSTSNSSSSGTQPATEAKKTIQVSIEIRCDSAVKIKDTVKNPGIKEKIPDSGEILRETVYIVPEGTNVYELLSQAAAANGIPITANTNKTYVMSINNLDQMMLSQQSGWKYSVNGNVPLKAASSYILLNGDKVKWFYVLSANEE